MIGSFLIYLMSLFLVDRLREIQRGGSTLNLVAIAPPVWYQGFHHGQVPSSVGILPGELSLVLVHFCFFFFFKVSLFICKREERENQNITLGTCDAGN